MKINFINRKVVISFNDKSIKKSLNFYNKHGVLVVTIFTSILSFISILVSYKYDIILAYNDSRAHMNMARLVFDNLKPGFAQLGGVWLPFPHIMILTLVWNDWLWQSGIAGSIYSMSFYVLSSIYIFKLLRFLIKDKVTVFICTLNYVINVNLLYMQSTPMTELTLIFFFITSVYYLLQWVNTKKVLHMILLALSVFLATLTRYDGWMQFLTTLTVLIIVEFMEFKTNFRKNNFGSIIKSILLNAKMRSTILFFSVMAGLGILLWILWNYLIFDDPIYFAVGPYSARAQQFAIESAGKLFTKHNIALSLSAYWWAVSDNVGIIVLLTGIIGFICFVMENPNKYTKIVLLTLFSPAIFHIASLYLGSSVLVLPEMNINVAEGLKGTLFNARYGLIMLPAVSVFMAYFARRSVFAKSIVFFVVIFTPLMMLKDNYIITLTDGKMGSSSLRVKDVSEWLKQNADDSNELILTALSYNSALSFSTGFPLSRFIHEGTGKYWESSVVDPDQYADWIVMANGDVGDPLYDSLIKKHDSQFLRNYELKKRFEFIDVYVKKYVPDDFVYVRDSGFWMNGDRYKFLGVNSYDLIFRSPNEVASTLSSAKNNGIDVVRVWVFGEGSENLIQPEPGKYNSILMNNVDYVLATAYKLDMKVILVMSNYWEAYGGIRQYLRWVDLPDQSASDLDAFFTDSRTKDIYKDFIREIVLRKNSLTGELYKNDPAIFSWELMNEPRSSSTGTAGKVTEWIDEMSSFIRTLDKYHMITSGHEGHFSDFSINPYATGPFIDQFGHKSDFDIDQYISEKPLYEFEIIDKWSDHAKEIDRAFFIEEIGFSKRSGENSGYDRLFLYEKLFESAKKNDVQGVIVWNWALKIDDDFGISPLDPNDEKLIKLLNLYSKSLK